MKLFAVTPRLLLRFLGVATLVASPLCAESSAAEVNPPGTQEVYEGTVTEYADGADGAPVARAGSVQLEVVDGFVLGRFTFFPPTDPSAKTTTIAPSAEVTTECRGYLDPVTNRGFLKLPAPMPVPPDAVGPSEKVALLLRNGVLTGGTMRADGQVLAFRLERFLVVRP